jgi:hypothetical protein
MSSHMPGSTTSLVRLAGALAASILLAGCVSAGSGASPTLPPTVTPASPTPAPTATSVPTAIPLVGTLYLRAWETQALAPQYTFGWLPLVTISGGKVIDGMVAVPAIYPGPLWIDPSVQTISAQGASQIVAQARALGLLCTKSDFVDKALPGAKLAHLELIVDGTKYELTGMPDAVDPAAESDPGTPAAFAAFWQKVTYLAGWMPAELGTSSPYQPASLAVLAMPPAEASAGITPNEVPWPLATPFAGLGSALGNPTFRCAVVSGADLAKLLPVVQSANQLTRFVDAGGTKDSIQVRVLVPGEPGPCPA